MVDATGNDVKSPVFLQRIPRSVKIVILMFIVAKLLVFAVGYAAAYADRPSDPLTLLGNMFAKPLSPQDGPHYIDIAKNWYVGDPELDASNFIVFFPLYPLLIRAITFDLSYVNYSALIISNVCSALAAFYLYKLAKLDFDDGVAQKAVLFLFVFPTAYFLSAPYTEGLFFMLIIACLYYARLAKWPLAGSLGFLAALTRIGGLLMLPVLLVELLHQQGWNPRRILNRNLFWVFFVSGGFLIYLGINFQVWGDAFKFMEIQRVHWYNTLDPLTGLDRSLYWATNRSFPDNVILGYAPIVFATFGLATVVLAAVLNAFRRFRPSYIVYMALMWMLAVSTSMWISVPRYVMAMFPMFILLGTLTKSRTVNVVVTVVFAVPMVYFTYLFASGLFVF